MNNPNAGTVVAALVALMIALFVAPLIGICVGAFIGFVAGLVFPGTIGLVGSAIVGGAIIPAWQVGAMLGFVGSFFKTQLRLDRD